MKEGIHPTLNSVVFIDTSSGKEFATTSTLTSKETKKINGVDHFVIKVEISSDSHPFYTGKAKLIDTAGRVEKFKARRAAATPKAGKKGDDDQAGDDAKDDKKGDDKKKEDKAEESVVEEAPKKESILDAPEVEGEDVEAPAAEEAIEEVAETVEEDTEEAA